MKYREKIIKLGFAFIFVLLVSYVLAMWTVDFKYLTYSENEQIYLNSGQTTYTGERSIREIRYLEQRISIELRIKDGSFIDVITEPISGDLDIDIFLLVRANASFNMVYAYSMNVNSSRENITVEINIQPPSLDQLIFTNFPLAELTIVPVSGSGIVSLYYMTLHPVKELIWLCVIVLLMGTSFFIKNMLDLIRFRIKQ